MAGCCPSGDSRVSILRTFCDQFAVEELVAGGDEKLFATGVNSVFTLATVLFFEKLP